MDNTSSNTLTNDCDKLATAMAKAQADIKVAVFDKKANYGPYASFKSVREASIEALSKNGIAVFQPVHFDGTHYALETLLIHQSGQKISSMIRLIIDKNNMQGLGSAITYAKRYAWASIAGVVSDDDDDGAAAMPTKPQPAAAPRPQPRNYAPSPDELDQALNQSMPAPVDELFACVDMYKVPHKDMPGIIEEVTGAKIKSVDLNEGQIASVMSFIRHQYARE